MQRSKGHEMVVVFLTICDFQRLFRPVCERKDKLGWGGCGLPLRTQKPYLWGFFCILTCGHFFIALSERGREREKKKTHIGVRWKHQLVASHTCPDRGSNPLPGYAPWPGLKPTTLQSMRQCSDQVSHIGSVYFNIQLFLIGTWASWAWGLIEASTIT